MKRRSFLAQVVGAALSLIVGEQKPRTVTATIGPGKTCDYETIALWEHALSNKADFGEKGEVVAEVNRITGRTRFYVSKGPEWTINLHG